MAVSLELLLRTWEEVRSPVQSWLVLSRD
ncbi:unnamed protein product [Linum tenue]|uniref:Uncharacterized protein n=1 Tax=Linum tenue TaxID=586396 RepID=A0AAV0QW45_9ROSI|nr:unnamed protein product [Linum tenue]